MRALARLRALFMRGAARSSEGSATPFYLLQLAIGGAASAYLLSRSAFNLSAHHAIALGVIAFFLVPPIATIKKGRRLNAQFGELLPDAIDTVARIVRAGLPAATAIRTVGEEAEAPVGPIFTQIADQTEIGIPLEEALAKTSELVGDPDFEFFATAVGLQQSTGGNLVAALETLSGVIRKRRAVWAKAQATTAEVRISAMVLGTIPFAVAGALLTVAPTYLYPLFNDRRGNVILGLAAFCLLAAGVAMRAMIRNVETISLRPRRIRGKRTASAAGDPGWLTATGLVGDSLELARRLAPLGIPAEVVPRLLVTLELLAGCALAGVLGLPMLFGASATTDGVAAVMLGLALGWSIPHLMLDRLCRNRQLSIAQGLPDAIELLVIAVEAGLSLEDAINRIVIALWRWQPAMAGELALTAADLRILPDRDDAFRRLYERVKLPSLHSVVTSLSQTLKYGTPIAQELRATAAELRSNTLLQLEERANRLPVLLTIPMVGFILPSILMIICGPAFLIIWDAFVR